MNNFTRDLILTFSNRSEGAPLDSAIIIFLYSYVEYGGGNSMPGNSGYYYIS